MSPISIIVLLAILSILPLLAVICTSFLKISVVLLFLRESLSLQQIPPNIVIYGMSIILSIYTMGPVCNQIFAAINQLAFTNNQNGQVIINNQQTIVKFSDIASEISQPLKSFLNANASNESKLFFSHALVKMWKQPYSNQVKADDAIILVPAFMITQLNDAFKLGFLLYLPSLIIDIFVSNLLLALGMMMMSPVTISTPIKLLLFILIGGWTKIVNLLLHAFVMPS